MHWRMSGLVLSLSLPLAVVPFGSQAGSAAPAADLSNSVTLKLLSGGDGFKGKVKGDAKCRKNRKVTFLRSALGSNFYPYGQAVRTTKKGKYNSDQFYDQGNYEYKAQIKTVQRKGDTCPAAVSKAAAAG